MFIHVYLYKNLLIINTNETKEIHVQWVCFFVMKTEFTARMHQENLQNLYVLELSKWFVFEAANNKLIKYWLTHEFWMLRFCVYCIEILTYLMVVETLQQVLNAGNVLSGKVVKF